MNRPAGERQTHSMETTAQVVRESGFGRIVGEVAISCARKQPAHGQKETGCQRSPHVSYRWLREPSARSRSVLLAGSAISSTLIVPRYPVRTGMARSPQGTGGKSVVFAPAICCGRPL